jgi:sterol desaturase/sphingolipid hydroxylase (fatty acid hydroxylase superfamily)
MDWPNPVIAAIPFFALFIFGELIVGHTLGRPLYRLHDTAISLSLALLSALSVAAYGLATTFIFDFAFSQRLFNIDVGTISLLVCLLIDDMLYYALHRCSHRVRWLWASHVVHHSSPHYNFATALRQNVTSFISMTFVFRLPLIVIGFPPSMVMFCAGIGLIYQFWLHTETIGTFPRIVELIFNTPNNHRIHHATNEPYIDRNYGGILMIWDHVFRSYAAGQNGIALNYGIRNPPKSLNVVSAALHEWFDLFKDIRTAETLRDKVLFCVKEPGWKPCLRTTPD